MQAHLFLLVLAGCTSDPTDTGPGPDDTAPADTGDHLEPGDLLALMAAAEDLAWATWPHAQLVDAAALTSESGGFGPTHAADFDDWMLVLLANDGSKAGSIEIRWTAAGGFVQPIYHEDPYYGVMDEPIPRTLDLEAAIGLVAEAGHPTRFWAVAVNTPLWPPVDARYAFSSAEGHAYVDIVTGTVTVD